MSPVSPVWTSISGYLTRCEPYIRRAPIQSSGKMDFPRVKVQRIQLSPLSTFHFILTVYLF